MKRYIRCTYSDYYDWNKYRKAAYAIVKTDGKVDRAKTYLYKLVYDGIVPKEFADQVILDIYEDPYLNAISENM